MDGQINIKASNNEAVDLIQRISQKWNLSVRVREVEVEEKEEV